jgi:hypothetical protein
VLIVAGTVALGIGGKGSQIAAIAGIFGYFWGLNECPKGRLAQRPSTLKI